MISMNKHKLLRVKKLFFLDDLYCISIFEKLTVLVNIQQTCFLAKDCKIGNFYRFEVRLYRYLINNYLVGNTDNPSPSKP